MLSATKKGKTVLFFNFSKNFFSLNSPKKTKRKNNGGKKIKKQIKTCLIVLFAIMFTICLTMLAACIDGSEDISSNQTQTTLKFVLNDDKASYSCVGFSENESYDKADNAIVVIPDVYEGLPVTSIGENAFFGCTGLTSIVIDDGVTFIGESAFGGCVDLTKVYYGGSAVEWNNITISSDNT